MALPSTHLIVSRIATCEEVHDPANEPLLVYKTADQAQQALDRLICQLEPSDHVRILEIIPRKGYAPGIAPTNMKCVRGKPPTKKKASPMTGPPNNLARRLQKRLEKQHKNENIMNTETCQYSDAHKYSEGMALNHQTSASKRKVATGFGSSYRVKEETSPSIKPQ